MIFNHNKEKVEITKLSQLHKLLKSKKVSWSSEVHKDKVRWVIYVKDEHKGYMNQNPSNLKNDL